MSEILCVLSLKMRVPFGNYKGNLVEDVLHDDPGWLIWVHNKVDGWIIEPSLLQRAEDALRRDSIDSSFTDWEDVPF
jgi:hypothetical protein